MTLNDTPLAQIDEARLQGLVAVAAEDRHLEFKREVPLQGNDDRREFLYDVSSFANGDGGDIVIGMEADAGIPNSIHPLPAADSDALVLKIEQMVRDGIQPRLPSFQARQVAVRGGRVVILRIGRSWQAPHCVTHSGANRFYVRDGAGKHQMDVQELRHAFARTGSTRERLLAWRRNRIEEVRDHQDEPVPSVPHPRAVLHLVPLAAADGLQVDLLPFDSLWPRLRTLRGGPMQYRWNFAGVATWIAEEPNAYAWTQAYRDGRFEAVGDATYSDRQPGQRLLRTQLGTSVAECLSAWLAVLEELEVQGPFVALLSLLDVKGVQSPGEWRLGGGVIDRRDLLFPDFVMESKDGVKDVQARVAELLANAVGRTTA